MKKKSKIGKKKMLPPGTSHASPYPGLADSPQYDTDLLHHQIVRFQEPQLFSLA